jgi:hypothetical protein
MTRSLPAAAIPADDESSTAPAILMPSIVDPSADVNGAATVSRGLVKLLRQFPLNATVDLAPARSEPTRHRGLRQLASIARGLVSPLPSKALFLHTDVFRARVSQAARSGKYQLVIINGSDLLWLLEDLQDSPPVIVVAHNIEHFLYKSQIQHLPPKFKPLRPVLMRDLLKLRRFELAGLGQAVNTIFLSSRDAARASSLCPNLNAITVPPVFDYPGCSRDLSLPDRPLDVGFVGNFQWWPNRISLHWLVREVLPHTENAIRLHLFGPNMEQAGFDHPAVVKHGMVESFGDVANRCSLLVCPAGSGEGINVKLAEAVYNRIPVLCTSHAVRGFPPSTRDDPAVVVRDAPREWADFLKSDSARTLAAKRVSEEAASEYSIERHKSRVQQFVSGILARPRQARPRE